MAGAWWRLAEVLDFCQMWFYYMFINKQGNFERPPVLEAGRERREQLPWAIASCLPILMLRSRVKWLCRALMDLQSNLLRTDYSQGNSCLTSRLSLWNHLTDHDGQKNWSLVNFWTSYGTEMADRTLCEAITPYWDSKTEDFLQFGKAITREKQGEASQGNGKYVLLYEKEEGKW